MLPPHEQKKLVRAKIKPGCIIHINCDFLPNPHHKFVVVAYVDHDYDLVLVFLINSRIPKFISNNPVLAACQVALDHQDHAYSFLDHQSYIDCTKVTDELDLAIVIDHLYRFPKDYKGELAKAEVEQIVQIVHASQTIAPFDKELIVASMGD